MLTIENFESVLFIFEWLPGIKIMKIVLHVAKKMFEFKKLRHCCMCTKWFQIYNYFKNLLLFHFNPQVDLTCRWSGKFFVYNQMTFIDTLQHHFDFCLKNIILFILNRAGFAIRPIRPGPEEQNFRGAKFSGRGNSK